MNIYKKLVKVVKTLNKIAYQEKCQLKLLALLGKQNKNDFIRIYILKRHFEMIQLLEMYGVKSSQELDEIINKSLNNETH